MITIVLNNSGGELDRRTARTPEEAAQTLVKMIQEAGEIYPGDEIVITGDEVER